MYLHKKLLLLVMVAAVFSAPAQVEPGVKLSQYVFDTFYPGTVTMKSGEKMEKVLNYSILTGEMIFDNEGKLLAMAATELVDTVTINDRKFVPLNSKFYEVLLPSASPLLLEFTFTIKSPGNSEGYGGESSTTATTAYKSLVNSGGAYDLKIPDGFKVIPGYAYWVLLNGKLQSAGSAKQLVKIFPSQKDLINKTVSENHTNFKVREEVISLIKKIEAS